MSGVGRWREWLELLEYIWRQRYTTRALIVSLFAVNFTLVPVVLYAAYWVLTAVEMATPANAFYNLVPYTLVLLPVLNATLIISWLISKEGPYFRSQKAGIFVTAYTNVASGTVLLDLYGRMCQTLQEKGLSDLIECKILPTGQSVNNPPEAAALLHRTGARLVIYGRVESGAKDGKQTHGFSRVAFTFRTTRPTEDVKSVARAMTTALVVGPWAYSDDNSFLGRDLVANNLTEVSQFFVALALTLDGKTDPAIRILRKLLQEDIVARNQAQKKLFRSEIKRCLVHALLEKFNEVYDKKLVERIGQRSADEAARQCEALLDEADKLEGRRGWYDSTKAICRFHFGDIKGARTLVAVPSPLTTNSPGPYISQAFLELWDFNFAAALEQYRRSVKCEGDDDPRMLIGVVRFLDAVADNHPDKPQVHFGLAFVNDNFLDESRAREEYKRFLEATEGDSKYGILIEYARERMRAFEGS